MARPAKNNADYFGHDHDMRNHRKIKAIRAKFGLQGYAMWCMLLEALTGAESNRLAWNDLEIELLAGDFGVSVTEITELVDYCHRLELICTDNGKIYSKSLDEKLKSVYEKRSQSRQNSSQQGRNQGKFDSNNRSNGVSVTEMPQSKGKVKVNTTTDVVVEEKEKSPSSPSSTFEVPVPDFVKKNREEFVEQQPTQSRKQIIPPELRPPPISYESALDLLIANEWLRERCRLPEQDYLVAVQEFISEKRELEHAWKDENDLKTHFLSWANIWRSKAEKAKQEGATSNRGPIAQTFEALEQANRNIEARGGFLTAADFRKRR